MAVRATLPRRQAAARRETVRFQTKTRQGKREKRKLKRKQFSPHTHIHTHTCATRSGLHGVDPLSLSLLAFHHFTFHTLRKCASSRALPLPHTTIALDCNLVRPPVFLSARPISSFEIWQCSHTEKVQHHHGRRRASPDPSRPIIRHRTRKRERWSLLAGRNAENTLPTRWTVPVRARLAYDGCRVGGTGRNYGIFTS